MTVRFPLPLGVHIKMRARKDPSISRSESWPSFLSLPYNPRTEEALLPCHEIGDISRGSCHAAFQFLLIYKWRCTYSEFLHSLSKVLAFAYLEFFFFFYSIVTFDIQWEFLKFTSTFNLDIYSKFENY